VTNTQREEFDVIVIGFGAAGACAAIEAADAGARVLVLERFDGGGASRRSGGSIYLGGGTETQRAAGFDDDPERMLRYLSDETHGAVSEPVLRAFCAESADNLRWLAGMGLRFDGPFFAHKTTHPPNGYSLYYSGNERQHERADDAPPRGHVPTGVGMTGGVLFAALKRAALARGVEVRTHSQATRLLSEESAVVGAEVLTLSAPLAARVHRALCDVGSWSRPLAPWIRSFERAVGSTYQVRARSGVVLSAGGFIFDREMIAAHAHAYARCMPLGTPGDDGAGIRLGQSVGAAVERMEECAAWRFIYPPEAFVSGLLVNMAGARLCDESLYGATICRHVAAQPDGRAYLIIDAAMARRVHEQLAAEERLRDYPLGKLVSGELNALVFRKYSAYLNLHLNRHRASTIEELERRCALPGGSLQCTVARYNERIARGEPDELGKADGYRQPLTERPFRAINCDLDNQLFLGPCITLGGLRTDGLTAQVLRPDGSPIAGLFAAGRTAAGICAGGYVSGLSLADCIFEIGRASCRERV
jgi:3-oxo-5alpha-steroid 4-dehydrogenase